MKDENNNKPNIIQWVSHGISLFTLGFSTAVLIVKIFIL